MKKASLFPVVITLLLLTASCAGDSPDPSRSGNAISFSATVPGSTRSASTTTASIKDFTVYAFTEGSVLMDGVKVTKQGGSWVYDNEAYWPVSPVSFYAYSPDINVNADITGQGEGHIPGYVCGGNVDLLYTVKKNVMQQAAPVQLNFRHALSKVSVLMSSTNSRIRVSVSYIALKNIYCEGTFTFPDASTDATATDATGSWSELKRLSSLMTFAIIGDEDRIDLTPQPTDYSLSSLDLSYVIPQTLQPVELSESGYTGTYIEVDCEIFDVATGAKLWPTPNTPAYMLVPHTESGRIIYPAAYGSVRQYLPGHSYIYNIAINNPSVLDKIEFDVTVDDYSIDQM